MAAACLVKYVNKTKEEGRNFTSLEDMNKHMAEKSSTQEKEGDNESSEDDDSDWNNAKECLKVKGEKRKRNVEKSECKDAKTHLGYLK